MIALCLSDYECVTADREFVAAIREGREPNASVAMVLPCYEVLDQIERQLLVAR